MLFLKGILFDTVPVVFIGNLPLKKNPFFLLKFRSLLRGQWALVAFLIPFPSWTGLLWSWFNSSNNEGSILNHHEKLLKNRTFFCGVAFFMADTVQLLYTTFLSLGRRGCWCPKLGIWNFAAEHISDSIPSLWSLMKFFLIRNRIWRVLSVNWIC